MDSYINEPSYHYDCDGVLRDFHPQAFKVFFDKYPQYKKYMLPVNKFRGWAFVDQLKRGPDAKKIEEMMWKELFEDPDMCFRTFGEAPALVRPEEWEQHIELVRKEFPNALFTISTHQYTDVAREATTYWLSQNKFTFKDEVNVLYTGSKDKFGAHFLLDDKPSTIEQFHKPFETIGVLFLNEKTNGWYVKQNKGKFKFPYAKTLNDYYKIISEKTIEII